jgi:hypothetical protein
LQVYEKLALDPNVKPTLAKEGVEPLVGHYIQKIYVPEKNKDKDKDKDIAEVRSDVHNGVVQKVWTLEQYPLMKDYLAGANPFIDLVGEAVRKPAYRSPSVRKNENDPMLGIDRQNCHINREIARSVQARANYRIGIGDIDGAIYDTITIHRLGRHVSKLGTLVGSLVGLAIEGSAAGVGGNPEHQPTKGQLEHFLKEIQSLPDRCTFAECLETERFFGLGSIQDTFRSDFYVNTGDGIWEFDVLAKWLWLRWSLDRNAVLRQFNDFFAQAKQTAAVFDEKSFVKSRVSSNPFRYLSVRSRSENISNILLNLFVPATDAARKAFDRSDCCDNMKCLTLALLLYEKEHSGKMPEGDWQTWQAAIKPYLGKEADKYFHCPSAGSPEETAYVLVRYDNAVPVTPETILPAEAEKMNVPNTNGLIPNEQGLFTSKHPGVYYTALHSGAVQGQSKQKPKGQQTK